MKRLVPVLVPTALFWASSALAYDDVACNPDGTQMEMNACAFDELQEADDELNAVYSEAMAFARSEDAGADIQSDDDSAAATLKKAQRQWIRDRDRQCGEASADGGSMQSMEIAMCLTEQTEERTSTLRALLEEGRAANEGAQSEDTE